MKKIIILTTTILATAGFLFSCGGSNEELHHSSIEGTWNCTHMSILATDVENTDAVDADKYINKAFADVVGTANITRVFVDETKLVYTFYTDYFGTEKSYSILNYKLQKDTLYLSEGNKTHKYRYTLSDPILTTEWTVNKAALDSILIDMDKATVALRVPDDYEGKITFMERKSN